MKYKLLNVYRENKKDPGFYSPKVKHLVNISLGDVVRLLFLIKVGATTVREDVLVKITITLPRGKFVGRVRSASLHGVRYDDRVEFNKQHIYYVEGSGDTIPASKKDS
jgi:hypothetical protein